MAWMGWFIATMLLAAAVGGIMLLQGPAPAVIAWLIFFLGAAAILPSPDTGFIWSFSLPWREIPFS